VATCGDDVPQNVPIEWRRQDGVELGIAGTTWRLAAPGPALSTYGGYAGDRDRKRPSR
jgi:hypothetical protein